MDDSSIQQKSVSYLKSYLVAILNSILESTERCPYVMKQMFHNLYNTAVQRFTDNEEVKFYTVSQIVKICVEFFTSLYCSYFRAANTWQLVPSYFYDSSYQLY